MPRPILVTGCEGQLGRCMVQRLGPNAVGLTRGQFDITDPVEAGIAMRSIRPSVVINAAAYTNVDGAETDSQQCDAVNHRGVANLASMCNEINATLAHISTDYVFGNASGRAVDLPFTETDLPAPVGVYARSKLSGERAAARADRHLIIRTCGLYDVLTPDVKGKNFCTTILRLAQQRDSLSIVDDQWCNPSYVPDVCDGIVCLLDRQATGLVHVVNQFPTTWCRLASFLLACAEMDVQVNPIGSEEYASPVERPRYSALCTDRFQDLCGYSLRGWQEAILEFVQRQDPSARLDGAARLVNDVL